MINRKIAQILNPKASQGFLGQGHTAIRLLAVTVLTKLILLYY